MDLLRMSWTFLWLSFLCIGGGLGIIPELDGDDVLRLQYLHDVEADVDSVQIASEFGTELFAYVVAAMRARLPANPTAWQAA